MQWGESALRDLGYLHREDKYATIRSDFAKR
jgi:hypothetical protein